MGTLRQSLMKVVGTYEAQAAAIRKEIAIIGEADLLDEDFTSLGAVSPYSSPDMENSDGPVYVVLPVVTQETYDSLVTYLSERFGSSTRTYDERWLRITEFLASPDVTIRLTSSISRGRIAEATEAGIVGTLFE